MDISVISERYKNPQTLYEDTPKAGMFLRNRGWRCVPAGSEKKGKERLKKMIEKKKKRKKKWRENVFFFSSFCLTCQSSQRGRWQEIDDVIGFSWGCFGLHGEFVVFLPLFVINFERTF